MKNKNGTWLPIECKGTPYVARLRIHNHKRGIRNLTQAQFDWVMNNGHAKHLI